MSGPRPSRIAAPVTPGPARARAKSKSTQLKHLEANRMTNPPTTSPGPTEALDLARGFFARRFATFTEAMMQQDPSWILLGIAHVQQPADEMPWKSRRHRHWFCLLVAAAEGEIARSERDTWPNFSRAGRRTNLRSA